MGGWLSRKGKRGGGGGDLAMAAGVLGYVLVSRGDSGEDADWNLRLLRAALAANAGWGLAGVAAGLATTLCPGGGRADFCPTELTAILVALAAGAAQLNQRRPRFELRWCTYLFLGLATTKLAMQNLRHGQALAIVISVTLYGGSLGMLPRMLGPSGR
ncbi:MAG: hypothetical protein IT158_11555 [Bryobacterales bacterium]|nr:hypothetical protein [Bryobacterales bacterium]